MLDPHRASRRRSQRGVLTATSLDAGFLVGAENELGGPQGPTVPASLVQVENATCFFGELRVAGKDPTAMSPRDRKSTRLNSSHLVISYAVFCLKKKKNKDMKKM